MTKEEWKQVQESLKRLFYTVKLKADDFEIAVRLERVTTYKNALMIYVNGEFKGEWLLKDCEERRRFIQHKQPYVLHAKERAEYKKMSKKLQKQYADFYERRYDVYTPLWSSFSALKKHLIENNEHIELLEIV